MSKGEGPSDERLKHEANKQCDAELMLQLTAIGVSNDDDTFSKAAYSTFPINGKLQNLKLTDPNRDSIIFALLFPYGVQGWTNVMSKITQIIYKNQNLDLNNKDNEDYDEDNDNEDLDVSAQDIKKHFVSISDNCKFRLAAIEGFSVLHSSGKLFQEYILYAAISIISARLNLVQTHQKQLRVESYKGLRDYVDTIVQKEYCLSGDKKILPASFEGGVRSLSEYYHDSKMIMNFQGMSDLSVTFTANIHLKEITDLIGKIDPSDRPDIIC
ncbi:MAG: putative ATP-dependent DNA helicase PIF1 [Streblomastix strix]|uniref:Putative ATP-dependent DNA helicase PIF1 n=1 Tax=Streblomastix strix TaxID=222440 RepID=A0A5J4WSW7_9EUKA|nr:MAG: putative ATP-dependent DNA helicase PIF1 [Streblomastix strix]